MKKIQKWEYLVVAKRLECDYYGMVTKDSMDALNLRGQAGWELAGIQSGDQAKTILVFKRPILNSNSE